MGQTTTTGRRDKVESQNETGEDPHETGRIEAFSDGVFAIAITLLILDLKVPPVSRRPLLAALLQSWPSYLAFGISFAFIGVMWINHHRLFSLIRRADHGLLLANGLLLFGVTVVPFPTSLLAAYLGHPGERLAAMIYSGTYVLIALFFNLLWRYASHQNRLLDRRADPTSVTAISRAYAFGPLLYLITLAVALFSVPACIALNVALALFFALPERHQLKLTSGTGG